MRTLLALSLVLALVPSTPAAQQFERLALTSGRWYKGNTHSHTTNTDGDSPPATVIEWYKARGFNFLVISDHDTLTEPSTLRQFMDSAFVLVPGEEVTGRAEGGPVHLTAVNVNRIIRVRTADTRQATLQANVDAIRAGGAIPIINHPNYRWSLDSVMLRQTSGYNLFELYNGHPHVHNEGSSERASTEELWDQLLTSGRRVFGVASDDSHHFQRWSPESVNPGKAWIAVRASRLDPVEIARNLDAGLFYASTGIVLQDVIIERNTIEVKIEQAVDYRYTTEFIGDGGRVLARVAGLTARYTLGPGVKYVRARVTDSGGRRAWTQPAFVGR